MKNIEKAIALLREGKPILIYDSDSREEETDIVYAAQMVTKESVLRMRKDGGGLICVTMPYDVAQSLGLRFLHDILMDGLQGYEKIEANDIPYGERSAFSVPINHRRTRTGITDRDRALTIREFARIVSLAIHKPEEAREEFGKNFRSPGHVATLIAAKNLLEERRGHTELSTAMMFLADLIPSAAIVEMLGDDGYALYKNEAKNYAERNDLIFLEGEEVREFWLRRR